MSDRLWTRGAPRALRAFAVAAAVLGSGLSAHVLAGGMLPSAASTASIGAVLFSATWALSRWRWSAESLCGLFILSQAAVHVSAMSAMPMHDGHSMLSPAMIASHLLAAALVVGTVLRGEAALWSLIDVLALRCLRLLRAVRPALQHTALIVLQGWTQTSRRWSEARGRAPPMLVRPRRLPLAEA